jgi:hypothetical protein
MAEARLPAPQMSGRDAAYEQRTRTMNIPLMRPLIADSRLAGLLAHDRLLALVAAILAALAWHFSEPIVFTNDSFGYLNAARHIAGLPAQNVPYYRMPLFPLFLVATGVIYDTFVWFILAQIALGILMVIIFHDGLRLYSRPAALVAVAVFIFTFVPFVYSKSIMTEQLYLFGLILCLSSTLRYFSLPTPGRLALIATAILMMMLTRVQGILIGIVVLPFLLYAHPARWRSVLGAAVIVAAIVAAYAAAYSAAVRNRPDYASTSGLSLSNSFGKYLFMVPYLDAERYFGWKIVKRENGPASAKLVELVGDAPADLNRWWAIWQTLDKKIGIAAADDLLLRATIEAAMAHPFKVGILYAHNFLAALYRIDSPYVWQHPPVAIGNERLDRELRRSGDQSSVTRLARVVNPLFHFALLTSVILVLVTVGAHGRAWSFCLALYLYNLVTIAASAAPEGRMVFYGLPLLLAALATARSQPWLVRLG